MKYFPIFLQLQNQRVIVAGAGQTAVAKLRLLLKTKADIRVFGANPDPQVITWANENRLSFTFGAPKPDDIHGAALLYAASDDATKDAAVAQLARQSGVLVNIVDNLADSAFLTPAIVDRDPVTIAIGTEGTAPVIARKIKADIEATLPVSLGALAKIGAAFRPIAENLPAGLGRRKFWSDFFFNRGAHALAKGGRSAAENSLQALYAETLATKKSQGRVALIGAGPGDPELLTLKARNLLHDADVIIHDQLVPQEILELARREALIIQAGKRGFAPSWKQQDINDLMIKHATNGLQVARLKSGDPTIYGRLDEELDALDARGISWEIIPGITAASASAATLGQSLTKRGRNSDLRIITGHDMKGFAEHDWRDLARPGTVAAIYMGKHAAGFLRGRLLMHGADQATPVTAIENASQPNQKTVSATLISLPETLAEEQMQGPVLLMLGLQPRSAQRTVETLTEQNKRIAV